MDSTVDLPYVCRRDPSLRLATLNTCQSKRENPQEYNFCANCAGALPDKAKPVKVRPPGQEVTVDDPPSRKAVGKKRSFPTAWGKPRHEGESKSTQEPAALVIICGRCKKPVPQPYPLKADGSPFRMCPACRTKVQAKHSEKSSKNQKSTSDPVTPDVSVPLASGPKEAPSLSAAPGSLASGQAVCRVCGKEAEPDSRFLLAYTGRRTRLDYDLGVDLCGSFGCLARVVKIMLAEVANCPK